MRTKKETSKAQRYRFKQEEEAAARKKEELLKFLKTPGINPNYFSTPVFFENDGHTSFDKGLSGSGISLIDEFAGKIAAAHIANPLSVYISPESIAKKSYELAIEMLKYRSTLGC